MNEQHIQKLLKSTQELFRTTHKHVVDEIVKRNGYFFPFGIGVSADGEYLVAGIENPDPVQALSFAIQALKDFARRGKLITAATYWCKDHSHTLEHVLHPSCRYLAPTKTANN